MPGAGHMVFAGVCSTGSLRCQQGAQRKRGFCALAPRTRLAGMAVPRDTASPIACAFVGGRCFAFVHLLRCEIRCGRPPPLPCVGVRHCAVVGLGEDEGGKLMRDASWAVEGIWRHKMTEHTALCVLIIL